MLPKGGFWGLELCLYGIRELMSAITQTCPRTSGGPVWFQVEVTFRLTEAAEAGNTVTIEAVTNVGEEETSKERSFTVALEVPSFVTISDTNYAEVIENTTTTIYAGFLFLIPTDLVIAVIPLV